MTVGDAPRYSAPAAGCAADALLALARDGAATTLVTGSFHTVGDAMARLQVNPLAG